MEKEHIVKLFLEKGVTLDKDSLNYFVQNEGRINEFLNSDKLSSPIVTKDILEKIFKKNSIEVLNQKGSEIKNFSVGDVAKCFSKRYEKMQDLIMPRLDPQGMISVNKIDAKIKKFSLVCLVNKKNLAEQSIDAEDLTGQTKIFLTKEQFDQLVEDEVIGIVCEQADQRIHANTIVFPDISLKKEITRSDEEVYCLFISDFHFGDENFKRKSYEKFVDWLKKESYGKIYICILGDVSVHEEDWDEVIRNVKENVTIISLSGNVDAVSKGDYILSNPSTIKIHNVTCLLFHADFMDEYEKQFNNFAPEQLVNLFLKKRNLNPTFASSKKPFEEDPYSIDIIPDLVVCGHFHKAGQVNYKGTTILTNGSFVTEPVFWLVNLKTREIIKLDFT